MFDRLEFELQNTGSSKDKFLASAVELLRKIRGQDIPIKEEIPERKGFSKETRRQLEGFGYEIIPLNDKTIQAFRAEGRQIRSSLPEDTEKIIFPPRWVRDHNQRVRKTQQLLATPSRFSEVTFYPDKLLLPESHGLTLNEHRQRVGELNAGLHIEGAQVVIGEAVDYLGLVFNRLDTSGISLFPEKKLGPGIRTTTPTWEGETIVLLFYQRQRSDAFILDSYSGDTRSSYVMPLVVPA